MRDLPTDGSSVLYEMVGSHTLERAASKPGVHAWDLKKRLDASMIEKGAVEFSFWSARASIMIL